MNYKEFFEKKNYPLQNEIFSILNKYEAFYLTGDTALARFYFQHRYSEDLDFFSQKELSDFKKYIRDILERLPSDIEWEAEVVSDTFSRIYLKKEGVKLKVDFVNEAVFRWGNLKSFNEFKFVDNEINILANKITSIERYEAKDIVDIWIVSKNRSFLWKEIMDIASKKALINPIRVSKIIKTMPKEELKKIRWAKEYDIDEIYKELQVIAKDILLGTQNSLKHEV